MYAIFSETHHPPDLDWRNKDFPAAYPKFKWKAGKTLNDEAKAA